jgi:hypothetical protein
VRFFGVPDLAGLVNVLCAQADFGRQRNFLLIWNNVCPLALLTDLAALLRRVSWFYSPSSLSLLPLVSPQYEQGSGCSDGSGV